MKTKDGDSEGDSRRKSGAKLQTISKKRSHTHKGKSRSRKDEESEQREKKKKTKSKRSGRAKQSSKRTHRHRHKFHVQDQDQNNQEQQGSADQKQYLVRLHGRTKGDYACGGCVNGDKFLKDSNKRRQNIQQYQHIELDDAKEAELSGKGIKKIPYIEECTLGPDGKPTDDCRSYQGWDESKWRRT